MIAVYGTHPRVCHVVVGPKREGLPKEYGRTLFRGSENLQFPGNARLTF
jgi:hypothetical protein